MVDAHRFSSGSTSQLQEAIDTIVQAFGHPETISVTYTFEDGQKRTMIEVLTGDTAPIYELVYDGQDDGAEPEITPVGEDEQSPKPSK
ncbi:hypothetical protein [Haloarchaeobius iranensis]|uniref:Uncharacterized protein n=1 Tax=Haloarchaeobius iranensis TaxID=996166 RepID=A0A1H0BF87_9EURY|nr:hypothetical protein [Haloarchaeobius iranensis]SDN44286.1 hypothetical protein SAMN05192554_1395 [Haloarchaeobius iranensis]